VEFQVIVVDLDSELWVAFFHRPEHLQDHINGAHPCSFLRGSAFT